MKPAAVEIRGISKFYPDSGITANDRVNFKAFGGEIHAIIGENGTGKSTLMHILNGEERPDSGEIFIHGRKCDFISPGAAQAAGIGIIHQHARVIPQFSVLENIILGTERATPLPVERRRIRTKIEALRDRFSLDLDIDKNGNLLTTSEIVKTATMIALCRNPEILIFDEPSSTFAPPEAESLFKLMKNLADAGQTIIFITHKLREVFSIAHRVSVMRQGKIIYTELTDNADIHDLTARMVGGEAKDIKPDETFRSSDERGQHTGKQAVYEMENISLTLYGREILSNVSFRVYAGEILAVTGIRETGLEDLEHICSGYRQPTSGHIACNGRMLSRISPSAVRDLGIGYVPSDRMTRGASLEASVGDNLALLARKKLFTKGLINTRRLNSFVESLFARFNISASSHGLLRRLSGGTIQKVILAREMDGFKDFLIISEPFWGLDFRSIEIIADELRRLAETGKAILIISSDLDDVLYVADRVIPMHQGRVVASLKITSLNREILGEFILGLRGSA